MSDWQLIFLVIFIARKLAKLIRSSALCIPTETGMTKELYQNITLYQFQVDLTPEGYKYSHLPKYMVTTSPKDRLKGWWQAENGKQEVQIQVRVL